MLPFLLVPVLMLMPFMPFIIIGLIIYFFYRKIWPEKMSPVLSPTTTMLHKDLERIVLPTYEIGNYQFESGLPTILVNV
jgi:ABC-type polysaccharide/polyol phosphate export permease